MAIIKTPQEIKILHEGGKILAAILNMLAHEAQSQLVSTTLELENLALKQIEKRGAEPAFKGYSPGKKLKPFPAALCTSVNEEVVHCIPQEDRVLKEGDIISLDLGIKYKRLFTDAALTVGVGRISFRAQRLIEGTSQALDAGIKEVRPGNTIGDVASAIQQVGKRYNLGVIRDLVGHGVGHAIHEPPSIPNYGKPGTLQVLKPGMVLAIEPMFTLGDWHVKFSDDGWTVETVDGSLAAHFEHTVAVTENGYLILTQ